MTTLLKSKKLRGPGIAALLVTALTLTACTAPAPQHAPDDSDILISQEACDRNAAAGTITYISGYGYSASAGQLDVFLAEELGYFTDLCLDVEINASVKAMRSSVLIL